MLCSKHLSSAISMLWQAFEKFEEDFVFLHAVRLPWSQINVKIRGNLKKNKIKWRKTVLSKYLSFQSKSLACTKLQSKEIYVMMMKQIYHESYNIRRLCSWFLTPRNQDLVKF